MNWKSSDNEPFSQFTAIMIDNFTLRLVEAYETDTNLKIHRTENIRELLQYYTSSKKAKISRDHDFIPFLIFNFNMCFVYILMHR